MRAGRWCVPADVAGPRNGSANSRSLCCERPAADVRRCRAGSAAAARSTACRDLVVVEGNLLCGETRGPGPGLAAGQCPAVRTVKGRTVRDHDPLQNCRSSKATREEGTVDEPTRAEWVIGEWVTLDRELHPFEALELATVIEAVTLHVLHGWSRWWAWTFASLVAQIAIGILEAAAGELVIVDHDVGETIH